MEIQGSETRRSELGDGPPPAAPPAAPPPEQTDAQERAEAHERFLAFAEGSAPTETDPAWDPKDVACGKPISNQVLFRQQKGDLHDVGVRDTHQGNLDDCSVLATLGALTLSAQGRALIHSAVVENKDDQGRTTSYTVTLYRPGFALPYTEPTTFQPVRINVDPQMCDAYSQEKADDGQFEVWTQVFEKAFAIFEGSAEKTKMVPNKAMEALTGRTATSSSISGFHGFGGYSGQQLISDIQAGKLVVLGTKEQADLPDDSMVGNHAYTVTGIETINGFPCAVVNNPWNKPGSQPPPVRLDQLDHYFASVSVGSVR